MNRWTAIALGLVTLAALGLRVPELDVRPLHNDEAVNALKLKGLWEQGTYHYDPQEYHGPVLYYASLPAAWLSGARDFAHLSEISLRLTPVVFGAGMILLLGLLEDGLGRAGVVGAAVFLAISPAFVFYSRYFVHETLLVAFTLLLLGVGWRYYLDRRWRWAVLGGAAVGLMYATKETFVLSLAALAGAAACRRIANPFLERWWGRGASDQPANTPPHHWNPWHIAGATLAAALVALAFFSSFFTYWNGPLDAVRTYLPWLHRAGGASPHNQPWFFYLERLLWFHHRRGPVWTEGAVLLLAGIGFAAGLRRRLPSGANPALIVFIGCYTLILAGIYSVISYKTPWCALSFWLGIVLLAGVGAAVVLAWETRRWLQGLLSGLLVLAAAQLLWQAYQTSFVRAADPGNPYTYAQTSPDILELVEKVRALGAAHPEGHRVLIKVMAPDGDYWPLPWYLRQFEQIGWWDALPPDPRAPIMIVGAKLQGGLEQRLETSHRLIGIFSLRPGVFLELFVEESLWKRYLAAKTSAGHN
jgi:uncharacterized protein (TIGR03663 family)